MHFNDGIAEFGFDCKARKLSDKSISNYQKQLLYLLRYLEAEFQVNQVEEVRSFHIKQFLVDMAGKGRKARYINDLLKVFNTFFNYMKKEGYSERMRITRRQLWRLVFLSLTFILSRVCKDI